MLDKTKFEENTKYIDKTINENNRSVINNLSVYKY